MKALVYVGGQCVLRVVAMKSETKEQLLERVKKGCIYVVAVDTE